jgi:hypothetical protein
MIEVQKSRKRAKNNRLTKYVKRITEIKRQRSLKNYRDHAKALKNELNF